jgi:hypothetical protein
MDQPRHEHPVGRIRRVSRSDRPRGAERRGDVERVHRWGFGIAQEIDSAAMSLWLKYRQHDGELEGGAFSGELDAFRYISTGALIYF